MDVWSPYVRRCRSEAASPRRPAADSVYSASLLFPPAPRRAAPLNEYALLPSDTEQPRRRGTRRAPPLTALPGCGGGGQPPLPPTPRGGAERGRGAVAVGSAGVGGGGSGRDAAARRPLAGVRGVSEPPHGDRRAGGGRGRPASPRGFRGERGSKVTLRGFSLPSSLSRRAVSSSINFTFPSAASCVGRAPEGSGELRPQRTGRQRRLTGKLAVRERGGDGAARRVAVSAASRGRASVRLTGVRHRTRSRCAGAVPGDLLGHVPGLHLEAGRSALCLSHLPVNCRFMAPPGRGASCHQ